MERKTNLCINGHQRVSIQKRATKDINPTSKRTVTKEQVSTCLQSCTEGPLLFITWQHLSSQSTRPFTFTVFSTAKASLQPIVSIRTNLNSYRWVNFQFLLRLGWSFLVCGEADGGRGHEIDVECMEGVGSVVVPPDRETERLGVCSGWPTCI